VSHGKQELRRLQASEGRGHGHLEYGGGTNHYQGRKAVDGSKVPLDDGWIEGSEGLGWNVDHTEWTDWMVVVVLQRVTISFRDVSSFLFRAKYISYVFGLDK